MPKLNGLRDFLGSAKINSSAIPREVAKFFREGGSGEMAFNGRIYTCFPGMQLVIFETDITPDVSNAFNHANVQAALQLLENNVGKEIETRALLGFLTTTYDSEHGRYLDGCIERQFSQGLVEYRGFGLRLQDWTDEEGLRQGRLFLRLEAEYKEYSSQEVGDLARFTYEGRIRPVNEIIK